MTNVMATPLSNWIRAMGSGSSVAIIEPMEGMKLSKKAITPNTRARSSPNSERMIQVDKPVVADVMNLMTM